MDRVPRPWIAASLLTAIACGGEPPPGVVPCPPLVHGYGASAVSYGGLAGSSDQYVAGSCVEVFVDGVRVALTYVWARSFAVQWVAPGDLRDATVIVRFSELRDRAGPQELTLRMPAVSQAEIGYEPVTLPVFADLGRATFEGWLTPTPHSEGSITSVLLVNWSTGSVAAAAPVPDFLVPFTARVSGRPGDLVSPLSVHGDSAGLRVHGYGGCWWPRGGGCRAECSDELLASGACDPVPCTGGRGCTVIGVDERHSGTPPPELAQSIPVGRRPPPPDTGPPPDAGVY